MTFHLFGDAYEILSSSALLLLPRLLCDLIFVFVFGVLR
jgi:hypothetical protein